MYASVTIPTIPQSQRHCLIVIKGPRDKITTEFILAPEEYNPRSLMQDIRTAYNSNVGLLKKTYYRGILLKKAVVSVVELYEVIEDIGIERRVLFRGNGPNRTLTEALNNPEQLADVPAERFFHEYEGLLLEAENEGDLPKLAIMIHLESDPMAQRIFGALVSTTIGIAGTLIKLLLSQA